VGLRHHHARDAPAGAAARRRDHTKDIDFTSTGVPARWQAGYADTLRMIDRRPWTQPVDPMDGVVVHQAAMP
jgi:hypothetical protein